MNPYNQLKSLVEEVKGTESEAMKQLAAITSKIKEKKERIKNAKEAAAAAKGKK